MRILRLLLGWRALLTNAAVGAAKYWRLTLVVWFVVVAAGGFAYLRGLDREGFPAIDTPVALAQTLYFADDPSIVDAEVTLPLGQALLEMDSIESISSFSGPNSSTIVINLDPNVVPDDEVASWPGLEDGLVPDTVHVEYTAIAAAKFLNEFDMLISVFSPSDQPTELLQSEAESLAVDLAENPSIARAEVDLQIESAPDPTTGEVGLRQTSFARSYPPSGPEFSRSILIGLIRADDGLDVLEFNEVVVDILDGADLEGDLEPVISADFARDINFQLSSLQSNLLTGLLAVAIISLLLIGWRVAIITAGFMVTVIAASLAILMLVGQSLNTITLFALILTLGLLVDDAIVITESIDANRDRGSGPLEVIRVAIDRVGMASLSGTATTVLVFMPMLFISGILGEFIRIMPITVIITLITSFVLSVLVIPTFARVFLLGAPPSNHAVVRGERWLAGKLERLISLATRNRARGIVVAAGAIALSAVFVMAAFQSLGRLSFNIFPPSKDANALIVEADFGRDNSLDAAETISDQVDEIIIDVVGEDLAAASYFFSDPSGSNIEVRLTEIGDRDRTANEIADELLAEFEELGQGKFIVGQIDNGPPTSEFPWAVQITADDNPAGAQALADDIASTMSGASVVRPNGEPATIVETTISTSGQVARNNNSRYIEVRGRFNADDITALTAAAQDELERLFTAEKLAEFGLPADAFAFDYGQETQSQESFASTQKAMVMALVLMLVLLVVQFRSLIQPILILLAIPFGLFGVGMALERSNNPLSFFVMIGLIGLIGVVVNNTILLTDAANQEWRAGASNTEAIATAVESRFRPLIATTATTVVGLAPLALSDPFWEPLALTIMFGLISSTILVLVAFPFYYLILVPPGRALLARVRPSKRR